MMIPNNSIYGYEQNTQFTDIWSDVDSFINDYKSSGIYASDQNVMDDEHARLLFFLLYARYGNNSIAASDRNRFKYQLFSLMFQYGPTWIKRLEIQDKLRALNEEDLLLGAKSIYNHAYNPGTAPSTATLDELLAINEQNTSQIKKGKLDGYAILLSLLDTDVTGEFLNKFKVLFVKFAGPIHSLWYTE